MILATNIHQTTSITQCELAFSVKIKQNYLTDSFLYLQKKKKKLIFMLNSKVTRVNNAKIRLNQ